VQFQAVARRGCGLGHDVVGRGITKGHRMDSFAGKIAVVTGGGTGMGRELVVQLAREGCHVAMCDVSPDNMAESKQLATEASPDGTRISTFVADVSDESALLAFRDAVQADQGTDHINLLFNNAGIGGGGSFVTDENRNGWERTFEICWTGVYLGSRVFMPMLVASDEGYIVNTASVNGFWATIGLDRPHTAYSAAKFAVKGFTEALITDLRINAPHVKAAVVMPGHIGTSIVFNSAAVQGTTANAEVASSFRDKAPTTAAQAATIILDGVRQDRWRILVGEDAVALDQLVREVPEEAYEPVFIDMIHERGHLRWLVSGDTPD